jgi:N-acetyl-alpha-D-glucosaminyl L-malate synthase BshA
MASTPLKLGIVCYPTIGGSGVVATEMAMFAARCGHQVHLLSYDQPKRLLARSHTVQYHNVQVSAYPLFRYPPYDLALATRMLEVQEEFDIDVFHVHYAIPHAISAYLANSMYHGRLKWVTTLHGTDITVVGTDSAYARPTRFAIEESTAVTAVSQFLADATRAAFGTTTPIEIIPNFVDTSLYRPGTKGRYYDRSDDVRTIVHISNFRPVKRIADVVRAFAKICREVPSRLLLVGDGPDREHALATAADTGCIQWVEHLGSRETTHDVLADADLFLLASDTGERFRESADCLRIGVCESIRAMVVDRDDAARKGSP